MPGWRWVFGRGTVVHSAVGFAIVWLIDETSPLSGMFFPSLLEPLGPALFVLIAAYAGVALLEAAGFMFTAAGPDEVKVPGAVPQRMMRVGQATGLILIWAVLRASLGNRYAPSGLWSIRTQGVLLTVLFALLSSLITGFWKATFALVDFYEGAWSDGDDERS